MGHAQESFKIRALRQAKAKKAIRNYFECEGFVEIQTPTIVEAVAIEPHIEPIKVGVEDAFSRQSYARYLATSPELMLKEALSEGLSRIYQLGPVFRDGEITRTHRPEFTMVEWYRAHQGLPALIQDCEKLIAKVAREVLGQTIIPNGRGGELDFAGPYKVISIQEAWREFVQIELEPVLASILSGDEDALKAALDQKWPGRFQGRGFEDLFAEVMDKEIEPQIGFEVPTILMEWPAQLAALAAKNPKNPLWAQRFELYAGGMELANAYHELVDPREQSDRFHRDLKLRARERKTDLPVPNRFLHALSGTPNCVGIALGFERLIMLIAEKREIEGVVLFQELW